MNGKTRITKVMNLELPDRVPFDGLLPNRSDIFYMSLLPSKSWQPKDISDIYPNVYPLIMKAGLWKWKPQNWQPPKKWLAIPRTAVDEFGCLWEYANNDVSKGHPTGSPLKDWDQLNAWKFPDPFDNSRYKIFGRLGKLFPQKYKVGMMDSFLFARVQYLRGFSQSLIDLQRNRNQISLLINKLKQYYLGTVEMWAKWGADAIYCQDDMGAQNELFMSPRMYQNFFAPAFKEIITRTHELGLKFILHSCGHVNKLIPIWADIGVDALQFDSPRMTGLEFDKQFVGKIVFHLVPDIQKVYPFANTVELEEEIKAMISIMGREGGLVIRDYLGAVKVLQVPKENHKILPKLVQKWGNYPISF